LTTTCIWKCDHLPTKDDEDRNEKDSVSLSQNAVVDDHVAASGRVSVKMSDGKTIRGIQDVSSNDKQSLSSAYAELSSAPDKI
jgi:hypothetical protein